jgi:hypothetical protein
MMPKNMKIILSVLFFSGSIILSAQNSRTITVHVKPYLEVQYYEHFKRFVLCSSQAGLEYIDGFNFDWGYHYQLSVSETRFEVPLSDGTNVSHSLKHIISKTKVVDSLSFSLLLTSNRYYHQLDSNELYLNRSLKPISDSTFLYFDSVEIEIPRTLQPQVDRLLKTGKSRMGQFIFLSENRIRLMALMP